MTAASNPERSGFKLSSNSACDQEWKFYDYGIVNNACGNRHRNLTMTSFPDGSLETLTNIAPLERSVSFSLVYSSTGMALDVDGMQGEPLNTEMASRQENPGALTRQQFKFSRVILFDEWDGAFRIYSASNP